MEQVKKKSSIFIRLIVAVIAIGFVIYFSGCDWAYGTKIGHIPVGDEFKEIQINIDKKTKIIFWTELSVNNESHAYKYADDLPHLLDYEIEVKQKGKLLYHLKCNPLNWHIASFSSNRGSKNRNYAAKIDGCTTINVPSGLITFRAKRKWLKKDKRFNFIQTDLIIKK